MAFLKHLSIRFRLSAAIAILFMLILLVSLIGMQVLKRTELWMNVLHQETLAEVSDALDLSQRSADLATSAPFLYALFTPFQLESDVKTILENLNNIENHAARTPELNLPIARLRAAIDDLTKALIPQAARRADLITINRNMLRLNNRAQNRTNDASRPLENRQIWAILQQLTSSAIDAGRASTLIELGEFISRYTNTRDLIQLELKQPHQSTYDEIINNVRHGNGLFVLKHRDIAARLDADNALFRIRQETSKINSYAEEKVSQAQLRLSQARAETSNSLSIAINSFLVLTLASLLVAVTSALYVSRYITYNLHRITDAMRKLAAGDHRSELPEADLSIEKMSNDEIGQLFTVFHVFRENARKLDRRTSQMRQQNVLFSRVFRNIKDGVAIISSNGGIEAENENLRKLLRLPPAGESSLVDMKELIEQSTFSRQTSAGERGGFEEYADHSGNVLEMRHSPLPDGGAVWLLSETTERKKVEERLEELRRVEALGKISGEVAHDFGNILSSISGNLHLLENADQNKSQHFRLRIRSALDLGVSLTERLLAFARKQHLEPQTTDIGLLIEGMVDLLEIALPDTISLKLKRLESPILARVDPGQLESAVLNLCMNASQATNGPGIIRIEIDQGDDNGARLTIQDDGCGMTPNILRRATEPFFTNRSDGNGTGLGLSMVDGFVHQSGGHLTITSHTKQPQQGTTVKINFPAIPDENQTLDHKNSHSRGSALVVDDDAKHLSTTSIALEHLGFDVVKAVSFSESIAVIQKHTKLDLVLSDLHLDNGASGWDILEHAHQQHPNCQLILMSTRKITQTPKLMLGIPKLTTLAKPITETTMRNTLSKKYIS